MDKVIFEDIVAEHIHRYRLDAVDGQDNVYDIVPIRGTVTKAGTPIRAAELNAMQEFVEEKAQTAANSATAAANAKAAAETAQSNVEIAAANAIDACNGAQIFADTAADSETAAANAATAAASQATIAGAAATAAEESATAAAASAAAGAGSAENAAASAQRASASAAAAAASEAAVTAAKTAAETAQAAAESAATNADTSAKAAQSFAANAQTARDVATEKAQDAEQNAAAACSNAAIASQKATEAEASAAMASNSAASAIGTAQAVQESVIGLVPLLINNAGAHNATYRGKNLGTSVTAAQWYEIRNGTFADLYIGDYWIINGITWRIAAFDYYYNTGDISCTTHHVVIVPDAYLYIAGMNETDTTAGGYVGSKMYTEGLTQAKTIISNAFGTDHILSHRQYLSNAVTNGKPSGGAWYNSTVELMTEQNVYGGRIFGVSNDGSTIPNLLTIDKSQFPLFVHDPSMISNRQWFWLRDVVSAARFAGASGSGVADYGPPTSSGGVRPAFAITSSWEDIQNAVRLGLGEEFFPVGYEFTTRDADTKQNIVWVVRAHDHHTAANNTLTHTMTLETKCAYSAANGTYNPLAFDATEALYYAADGLAAGTYNFTVANQQWYTADNGKAFQFTLTSAVPAGGQIVVSATHDTTLAGKSVKTYSNAASAEAIETATLTEGSAGTSLGTTDGNSPNVNHMHRVIFGSNNYAQSAARQWLNSAESAGSVWTPTNIFDRPASWDTSYNGFMHGLPADFLAVVQPAKVPCRTNSAFEIDSLDGTEFAVNQVYELQDKFFLLSGPEIFGTWDDASLKDGTQLEFYRSLTDSERIKYSANGTATNTRLRSPYPTHPNYVRMLTRGGTRDSTGANDSLAVSPACIIA